MLASQLRAWLAALRPRTLTASVMPVLAGLALASRLGPLRPLVALGTLLAALLIQVTVDLANDYFDYRKGVDTAERLGPPRATGRELAPRSVRAAMLASLGASALLGLGLVRTGGWPILAIGLAALLSALAYAGGPRPLGHLGLGEAFVFAFFGPVAALGTVLLQVPSASGPQLLGAALVGAPMGLLSAAILLVNNIRDVPTDARAGKRTIAVRLGAGLAWAVYAGLLAVAYAVVALLPFLLVTSLGALLPLVTLPAAIALARRARRLEGRALNRALVQTAMLHAAFGVLLAVGVLL
jgi:1,4-dihydroxy-2-naphthoate octaprenyltransferase